MIIMCMIERELYAVRATAGTPCAGVRCCKVVKKSPRRITVEAARRLADMGVARRHVALVTRASLCLLWAGGLEDRAFCKLSRCIVEACFGVSRVYYR